jgi:hypothetical protein
VTEEQIKRKLRTGWLVEWSLSSSEWLRLVESERLPVSEYEGRPVYVDDALGVLFVKED